VQQFTATAKAGDLVAVLDPRRCFHSLTPILTLACVKRQKRLLFLCCQEYREAVGVLIGYFPFSPLEKRHYFSHSVGWFLDVKIGHNHKDNE